MNQNKHFFARLAVLMKLFWTAILADALYIFSYIHTFCTSPSAAMARGETLTAVPAMMEHILMSAVMLLLCACAAEILHRQTVQKMR